MGRRKQGVRCTWFLPVIGCTDLTCGVGAFARRIVWSYLFLCLLAHFPCPKLVSSGEVDALEPRSMESAAILWDSVEHGCAPDVHVGPSGWHHCNIFLLHYSYIRLFLPMGTLNLLLQ